MKELLNTWIRTSANFTNVHAQLEGELRRMRDRKVEQKYIDLKDQQIEMLVDFYNRTDELIHAYRLALSNSKTENHFLTEMLLKKITLQELMEYKPSARICIMSPDGELRGSDKVTLTQIEKF